MTDHQEHLILKFLQGNISAEERNVLNAWINQSDENQKMVGDLQRIWNLRTSETIDNFEHGEEWIKLQTSLNREEIRVRKLSGTGRLWLKVAATILLLCVSSFLIFMLVFRPDAIVKETADASLTIVLPDGSQVWLNKKSRLSYYDDFADDRSLTLEGEAFFEVQPDPARPFIIRTPETQVKVLGTSFNVKAYPGKSHTEVFVLTGKVSLSDADSLAKMIVLTPGITGSFDHKDSRLMSYDNEDLNVLAWKERKLIFRKTPLVKVLKTLSVYFKTDFRVKNKQILDCRFTSTFNDPSITEVMETLQLSLNLEVEHEPGRYIIGGDGCIEN